MKKVNMKGILSGVSFLIIFLVASSIAYFSSFDMVTNKIFSQGLKITVAEDNYTDAQSIGYAQKITKQPKAVNEGKADAIVFLEVKIPKRTNLKLIDDSGALVQKGADEAVELFKTYYGNDATYNVGNWSYLSEKSTVNSTENGYNTYIYGYKKVLAGDNSSEVLFDGVQLINLFEIYEEDAELKDLLNAYQNIDITAYGIQANSLADAEGKFEVENADSLTDAELIRVWNILKGVNNE